MYVDKHVFQMADIRYVLYEHFTFPYKHCCRKTNLWTYVTNVGPQPVHKCSLIGIWTGRIKVTEDFKKLLTNCRHLNYITKMC